MTKQRKKRPGNRKVAKYIKTRSGLVFIVVLGLMLFLVGRIIYLNKNSGDEYYRTILSQLSYNSTTIYAERGNIYDRNGIVLAYNENQYILVLEPKNIMNKDDDGLYLDATVNAIIEVFGDKLTNSDGTKMTADQLKEKIQSKPNSYYMRLLKNLSEDEMQAFEDYAAEYNGSKKEETKAAETETQSAEDKTQPTEGTAADETAETASEDNEESEGGFISNLIGTIKDIFKNEKKTETKVSKGKVRGYYFEISQKREYPCNTLASTTIGFANSSGGQTGLEAYYDDILKGVNGKKYGYLNENSNLQVQTVEETDGNSIVSTIDYYVQEVCQELIDAYDAEVGSNRTAIMVMNPNTGEIYAMAHSGQYNLNEPSDYSADYTDEEWDALSGEEQSEYLLLKWRNFCVSESYEPGSTAKSFTVSAGLDENLLGQEQSFYCDGVGVYNGSHIHCHKTSGHKTLSVTGALMASCNDALMQMAVNFIGKDVFCEYQSKFNLGSKTGVDLPDELSCSTQIYTADRMSDVDLATNSFGQNYFVTMVQMCAAYSSIVNGGYYYKPHTVKQILDSDGNVIENIEPVLVRQTVSESTSEFMKEALLQVVENGTGKLVKIEGYEIGGKTGTAEKQNYGDTHETYTVSFMADAPAYSPEVIVYVVVDEPHVSKAENTYQAKGLAKSTMEIILPYLGIFPTGDDDVSDEYGDFTSPEEDEMYDEDSFYQSPEEVAEAEAIRNAAGQGNEGGAQDGGAQGADAANGGAADAQNAGAADGGAADGGQADAGAAANGAN